ncbi:MAG: NAD(P)-dependent oxidoreductase [Melioribacteraceae bacterium]|nr:NAD(P)-dependent oxidoreductase [Melioribacteraceae bacterium]
MKIFITGGSGLLGQYLNIELNKKHEILTQYYSNEGNCRNVNSVKSELTNHKKLEEIVESFNPEVIVHTAAVSDPEKADALSADFVYEINVYATQFIAELCSKYNVKLIYLSTDLVYAGYRGSMLNEDAKLIPLSLYAETKLMGEVKIRETLDNYVILREALLFGLGLNHSRNNFHKMYENLKEGKPVKLFTDQYRTPLALQESARMIGELIEKNMQSEIINFAGNERVSRLELGELFCEEAGFDKNLLVGTTMEEAGVVYKVADVSLNIDKLKSYGVTPISIRESIRKMFSNV